MYTEAKIVLVLAEEKNISKKNKISDTKKSQNNITGVDNGGNNKAKYS